MLSYTTVFLIVHICGTLCYYHCIIHILTPRNWVKYPLINCIFIFMITLTYELFTGDVRSIIRYFFFLFSELFPVFLFFKDKLFKKIMAWLFTFFLAMICESIVGNFLWPILRSSLHLPYTPLTIVPQDEIFALCIYLFPMVILECVVSYNGYKIWNYLHLNFNAKILLEIIICPMFYTSGILQFLNPKLPCIVIPVFLFFALGNLLFLKGVKDLADNMKNARNNQKIKKNLELLLSDYEAMEQQILSIHLQNHDIANHLRTVEYLISENQVDEAKEYLEKILLW